MKALELFAGVRSFGAIAEKLGYKVYSSDFNPLLNDIDYCVDIADFDCKKVVADFGVPDIIWASPDCAVWSIAAGGKHFNKQKQPISEKAKKAPYMVIKTLEIIAYFLNLNPKLVFWIENPVGLLAKQNFMQQATLFSKPILNFRKITIDQCQYGREFKKPTHIFTNDTSWKPRKRCKKRKTPNSCNHIPNGINNTSGEQYYKRAMLPPALFEEILFFQPKTTAAEGGKK